MIFADHSRSNIVEFDNIITVLVGEEEKRFIIHQDAACAKSKFFKAACSTRWLEGQEKIVRLRDVDPTVFQAYSRWVYSGELPTPICIDSSNVRDKSAEKALLIELLILGDRLDDIDMRNQAKPMLLDSMERHHTLCGYELVNRIYASTLPGSLVRKMLVDVAISRQNPSVLAKHVSKYAAEFVQEVAIAALESTPMISWEELKKRSEKWEEKALRE